MILTKFKIFLLIGLLMAFVIVLSVLSTITSVTPTQIQPFEPSQNFPTQEQLIEKKIQINQTEKNKKQEELSKIDLQIFNFNKIINKQKELIQKVEKSLSEYNCVAVNPIVHYFNSNINNMYLQTYYQVLPFCLNDQIGQKWIISRQTIQDWHKDTFGIEWALDAVNPGHRVLYYRPQVYNLLQIVMLSKFIGPEGSLFLVDFTQQQCLREAMNAHGMKFNIQFKSLSQVNGSQYFDIIIGNQTILDHPFPTNTKTKLFIYSADGSTLNKRKNLQSFKINKFTLLGQVCGIPHLQTIEYGAAFYAISSQEKLSRKPRKRQNPGPNSQIELMQSKFTQARNVYKKKVVEKLKNLQGYQKQKKCIDPNSNRAFKNFIFTIYGTKLYNTTLQQVKKWEEQRRPVQWVRARWQLNHNVYYQMKHNFNLLSIIEIALLIGNSSLSVVCSNEQSIRVLHQVKNNKLMNIKIISQTSLKDAQAAQIIITDNQQIIQSSIQNKYLNGKNLIFAYFTHQRNQSLKVLWKTYAHYQLKEVIAPQANNQCIGFEYFHFYWNSQEPNGFYQIKQSKYIIYVFWSGSPKTVPIRKKLLLQELAAQSVQTKIISSKSFYYFEIPESPIHPAYPYLSPVHKSDYFRGYMMYHYGGGYSDVKHAHFEWKPYFEKIYSNQTIYASGYHQINNYDVACSQEDGPPSCFEVRTRYNRLIGNGLFIIKKKTPLSEDWFTKAKMALDRKYQAIKKNPSQVPRDIINKQFVSKDGKVITSQYPLRWAQLAGQKLSRAQFKYLDHVDISMPYVIIIDYLG